MDRVCCCPRFLFPWSTYDVVQHSFLGNIGETFPESNMEFVHICYLRLTEDSLFLVAVWPRVSVGRKVNEGAVDIYRASVAYSVLSQRIPTLTP